MELNKKPIAITGGGGFIGGALVQQLAQHRCNILILDKKPCDSSLVARWGGSVQWVQGDIVDASWLKKVMDAFRPQVVIHLAAIHFIPESDANPLKALQANILGTHHLLRVSENLPLQKFLFVSSAAVYGVGEGPHSESAELAPIDVYGITKLCGEQWVQLFHARTGVPCIIVRLFNTYGPGETVPHLIPHLIQQAIRNPRVELGNLEPKRDYIHVNDVVRALLQLLVLDRHSCDIYNVGTGQQHSVRDVIQAVECALGRKLTIHQASHLSRQVDRPHLVADVSKIRADIGWGPTITFEDGIRNLVSHMQREAR